MFDEWTENREIRSIGTNTGAPRLAFQSWHRFKEAFAPEFVRRALSYGDTEIHACLDPFGGSGTTALAAQLLGVASTTIEVNPFLVDAIRAKLVSYDADAVARDFATIRRRANRQRTDPATTFARVPATFLQTPTSERWLFNTDVATELATLLSAINGIKDDVHRRLFRVLIGGMLIDVSNVVVSGKGRRYRRRWKERQIGAADVSRVFLERVQLALADARRFASRPLAPGKVLHGDARHVRIGGSHDVAVFSPPEPNSGYYTFGYNGELGMLGYLSNSDDNRALRDATFTSHVQLSRSYPEPPTGSRTLRRTLEALERVRGDLWSPWIPDMIGGYFADLLAVLGRVHRSLRDGALCWVVVGDR